MFLNRTLPFFLIIYLLIPPPIVADYLVRTNSSGLCSKSPSQSCSHLLSTGSIDADSCRFSAANHSRPQCNRNPWISHKICQTPDLCGADLRVYRHALPGIPLYRTAFNLTLSNIPNNFKVRYIDLSSEEFTFCFNFSLQSTVAHHTVWYDCVFHDRSYEGRPFFMEFLSADQYGALLFNVPTDKSLANKELFVYLHIHHLQQTSQAIITFQNLNNQNHSIVLCKWEAGECINELSAFVDLNDQTSYLRKVNDLITVALSKSLNQGNYSIRVDGVSTPFFLVQGEDKLVVTASVITLGLLITALVLAVVLYYKKRLYPKSWTIQAQPRSVLLIHDPDISDSRQLEALRTFLQSYACLQVWLDVADIPLSEHKDPLIWYARAVDRADLVAVWVDAPAPAAIRREGSIYQHTFRLALDLLGARIKRELENGSKDSASVIERCVVLHVDAECQVPDLCRQFRRFQVPREIRELIRCAYGGGKAPQGADPTRLAEALEAARLQPPERGPSPTEKMTDERRSLLVENETLDDEDEAIRIRKRDQLDEAFGNFPPSAVDLADANESERSDSEASDVKPQLQGLNLF